MAPGLPAAWSSRCAVCLLAAAGAALGPPAGSAHGSSAPDGPPSVTATAPGTSSPAATASASVSSPPAPSGSASPSALPSALPLPSGVPASGASGTWPGPSSTAATGDGTQSSAGAEAGSGPEADEHEPSASPSASPDVSGSTAPLAGREAGAGKERPGRSLSPMEPARAEDPDREDPPEEADEGIADPVDLPASTPPPDAFRDPGQRSGQALDAAAVRRVQEVSLGTGIALVGLGLGFLAFRMRRTN
ncbi:hypothetical protein F2B00_14725 [Streptomyces parvus]|uniref:hypothetical protein n=1 Tax=Streptomyces parvus TaxID=66428 RepID=UPI001239CBD9|nr:hypothetical protein [Streptomyces parvus]KAA6201477.1 hypothetical protein F2B00_14725 [Streptomyces parvus]GGS24681.1 hypothetical protein GCM10010221_22080 [Streptomyces parvus]